MLTPTVWNRDSDVEGGSRAQGFPSLLVADLHGDRAGIFCGRKDGKKIERVRPDVIGAVDDADREIEGVPCFHDAFLVLDPLFGGAGKNVQDLLHVWVVMKAMRFSGQEVSPDEH